MNNRDPGEANDIFLIFNWKWKFHWKYSCKATVSNYSFQLYRPPELPTKSKNVEGVLLIV